MRNANAKIRVEFGTPFNTWPLDPETTVRIVDDASGIALTDFKLTQAQLTGLIRGSSVTVEAWVTPPHLRDRVGKEQQVHKLDVPKEVLGDRSRDEDLARAQEWANDQAVSLDYEEAEVRAVRAGYEAVLRRWVAVAPVS